MFKKKNIIKEIVVGENKISCSQNSKGFWYCSEISIYCYNIMDGIQIMNIAIDEINKILEKKNMDKKQKDII